MRQEYKFTSKKSIVLLSSLGIIPFYFELIIYIFFFNLYTNHFFIIRESTSFYGALIISFLSGMQWEKLISLKQVKFYILPMLPVIFLWISFLLSSNLNINIPIIIGLLWCLMMDLIFIKNNDYWFIKIRVIITFLAIIPLFLIFFVV